MRYFHGKRPSLIWTPWGLHLGVKQIRWVISFRLSRIFSSSLFYIETCSLSGNFPCEVSFGGQPTHTLGCGPSTELIFHNFRSSESCPAPNGGNVIWLLAIIFGSDRKAKANSSSFVRRTPWSPSPHHNRSHEIEGLRHNAVSAASWLASVSANFRKSWLLLFPMCLCLWPSCYSFWPKRHLRIPETVD